MIAYIHIGTPKTGTNSIQQFLYANKDLLSKDEILYSSSIVLNRQFYPQHWDLAILLNNLYKDNIMQNGSAALLYNEIKNTKPNSMVLSSEVFQLIVKYKNIKNLKYLLVKLGFEKVNVILYIRDVVEVWIFLYSEFLKNGSDSNLAHKKIYENNLLRQILDYKSTLIHWDDIFKRDTIILRYFDKKYLYQNNLIKDFAHITEIKWNKNFVIPKRQNESLNLIGMEILKHLNNKHLVCNGILYHDSTSYCNSHFRKKEYGLTFYLLQNCKEYLHIQFEWINKHFNFPLYKYKMCKRYCDNYELDFIRKEYFVDIANFITDLFSSKNKTLLQKQSQINKMIFEIRYASAKICVQNHLSYKLGEALVKVNREWLGIRYIRLWFMIKTKIERTTNGYRV